ncbi:MAG: hypothetical protein A2Y79_05335 [Deltaproteobacteria bacterium RBG_13_43_22]|nr:MAG: hypothetical protein A2Y79_05335 [Deltaproteobacteria bacterium RBG_13_43_22]
MKKRSENNLGENTLLRSHPTYIKKKSQRSARWCCFLVVVLFFTGWSVGGTGSAAGNQPEVRVGSELDFPPYAIADKNGRPDGFSVELIKAVCGAMGLSVEISTGSWDTVWSSLVSGQLDVLPIVAKTPERQSLVDFSLPHTETFDAFFVRKGDPPLSTIAAARGKEIVVMRSDAAHHELLERNFQGNLILVDSIPNGLKLISSGKHNAFLCSKLIGTLVLKKQGLTNLIAGPIIPDYKRVFSFGVKKGDRELLEKLNQGLLIVKTNGEYDRIYAKWLTVEDPWLKVRKYLLPVGIVTIAIFLIAGIWVVMLQRLVRNRTRELAEKNEMLQHAQEELEARVQERTADLAQANQLLQVEITEHKQTEETLKESELRYRELFNNISSGVAIYEVKDNGSDFIFKDFNKAGERLDEDRREDIIGKSIYQARPGIKEFGLLNVFERVWKTGIPEHHPASFYRDERLKKWFENYVYKLPSGEIVAVYDDITERKQAEEKIRASLLEKEIMLKEIHHRVKNNLQVISSLFGLQSGYIQDDKSREIFQESQNRVGVMAKIHTMLYQSEDLSKVDFGGFIRDLAGRLQQSYATAKSPIEIHVDIGEVSMTIETSIPCGLILNELVSNALKHAFPEGKGGEVKISMATEGDRFVLMVQDNGIGFPADVDFQNTQTLGLELVRLLVGQINGTIDLAVDGGTKFAITFPKAIQKG